MTLTLKQWVEKYNAHEFDSSDIKIMIESGWHDWFCKDSTLQRRLKSMAPLVISAEKSPLINSDKVRIFFKNNCPMAGPTYDSFSIVDIESNDVLYWVCKKSTHSNESEIFKFPDFNNNILHKANRNSVGIKNYFRGYNKITKKRNFELYKKEHLYNEKIERIEYLEDALTFTTDEEQIEKLKNDIRILVNEAIPLTYEEEIELNEIKNNILNVI